MNVRGTQHGSSLRIPAPAVMASWVLALLEIVFVVIRGLDRAWEILCERRKIRAEIDYGEV